MEDELAVGFLGRQGARADAECCTERLRELVVGVKALVDEDCFGAFCEYLWTVANLVEYPVPCF